MSNDLTKKPPSAVANPEQIASRFKRHAQHSGSGRGNIVGHLLLFTKHGDYVFGQERKKLPYSTRMIVSMPSMMIGWVRWDGNVPKYQMGAVIDGYEPPEREALGDNDPEQWEVREDGSTRDPFQPASQVIMQRQGSKELFTFSTSSVGGNAACGDLSDAYADHFTMHPSKLPLVSLEMRSYEHALYGEIRSPVFQILDWVEPPAELWTGNQAQMDDAREAAELAQAEEVNEIDEEPAEEIYDPEPAPQPQQRAPQPQRAAPQPQRARTGPAPQPQRAAPTHGVPPRGKAAPATNGRRRREEIPY